ncbi:MAG: hypothetical protein ABH878_10165 [bacterium]
MTDNSETKPAAQPKPRKAKRLIKWLIIVVGIILCGSLFLFSARRLYLSDSFLIAQVEEKLSRALHATVRIEGGRIRLRGEVHLKNVALLDSSGREALTLAEILVRYRAFPLLDKRLVIDELRIVHPQVYTEPLSQIFKPPPDLQPSKEPTETHPTASLPEAIPSERTGFLALRLPFYVELHRLDIRNAGLFASNATGGKSLELSFGGLNLQSEGAILGAAQNTAASIRLQMDDALQMEYTDGDYQLRLQTPVALTGTVTLQAVTLAADVALRSSPELMVIPASGDSIASVLPQLDVTLKGDWLRKDSLQIRDVNLKVGDVLDIKGGGVVRDFSPLTMETGCLEHCRVDLGWLVSLLQDGSLWNERPAFLTKQQIAGTFVMENTAFELVLGVQPSVEARGRCAVREGYFKDNDNELVISGISLDTFINGQILPWDSLSFDLGADLEVEDLRLPGNSPGFNRFADLYVGVDASSESGWRKPRLQVIWEGGQDQGCELKGELNLRADRWDRRNPLAATNLSAEGGASVDRFLLSTLLPQARGSLTAAVDFRLNEERAFRAEIAAIGTEMELDYQSQTVQIPEVMLRTEVKGGFSRDWQALQIHRLEATLAPFLSFQIAGEIEDWRSWRIEKARTQFDLQQIQPLSRAFLPVSVKTLEGVGQIFLTASAAGEMDSTFDVQEHRLEVSGEEVSLRLPEFGAAGDSISLQAVWEGEPERQTLSGTCRLGVLSLGGEEQRLYHGSELEWRGITRDFQRFEDLNVRLELQELGARAAVTGRIDLTTDPPLGNGTVAFRFNSEVPVFWKPEFSTAGFCSGEMQVHLAPDSLFYLDGSLRADSLYMRYEDRFQIDRLQFELPVAVSGRWSSGALRLTSAQNSQLALQDPVFFSSVEHQFLLDGDYGQFHCDQLLISDYQIADVNGLLKWDQGQLYIPSVSASAYNGTLLGSAWLKASTLAVDSIHYGFQLDISRLNSAKLPGLKAPVNKEAEISAHARFGGSGFDPERNFSLEGGLALTQVGNLVADNILRFLDPDQRDPSIQTYRGYLKRGWGIRVFSFDVKDDFVYIAITPSRPSLRKPDMFILSRFIGLGRSVTFGRLPLKFFLSNGGRTGGK